VVLFIRLVQNTFGNTSSSTLAVTNLETMLAVVYKTLTCNPLVKFNTSWLDSNRDQPSTSLVPEEEILESDGDFILIGISNDVADTATTTQRYYTVIYLHAYSSEGRSIEADGSESRLLPVYDNPNAVSPSMTDEPIYCPDCDEEVEGDQCTNDSCRSKRGIK
jgi:hypothetical protein